jgi:type VI secretion system protein ImpK
VSAIDSFLPMQQGENTVLLCAPHDRHGEALAGLPPHLQTAGLNRLVGAANALLALVGPLRAMMAHPDVEALRVQLIQEVRWFESAARRALVEQAHIAAGRYALCTLLDETISSTPWGGGGVWASRSLLVAFHNEASGGEKFFLVLQRLARDPQPNLVALELMYLCLALGMEGRYRVLDGGRDQLAVLRERLQQLIADQHAPVEHALSVHWRGAGAKGEPLWRMLPVGMLAAGAFVVLVAMQLILAHQLARASDPVAASLLSIKAAPPAVPPPAPVAVAVASAQPVRLALLLAPEIAQGLVSVTESAGRSTMTLHGDTLFASGSEEVAPAYLPLLARIGRALEGLAGEVLVVGHTDNLKPGKRARYASNVALSGARAAAVRQLLPAAAGTGERYRVVGLADAQPVAPNDSPGNRARNRRVEISVLTAAPDSGSTTPGAF